jgi:hypothetical protein
VSGRTRRGEPLLLVEGLSSRESAERLFASLDTVKTHVTEYCARLARARGCNCLCRSETRGYDKRATRFRAALASETSRARNRGADLDPACPGSTRAARCTKVGSRCTPRSSQVVPKSWEIAWCWEPFEVGARRRQQSGAVVEASRCFEEQGLAVRMLVRVGAP